MKTQQEILTFLSVKMHGTWDNLSETAQLAAALGYMYGQLNGYDEGFQVGCASERGIVAMQKRFDEIDTAPPAPAPTSSDFGCTSNSDKAGSGEVHPVFSDAFKVIGL